MKKTAADVLRKHGYRARAVAIDRWLQLNCEAETHQSGFGERLKTRLDCSEGRQAYVWITDRGRGRLIKH